MIRSVRRLLALLTPRERLGALALFGLLLVGAGFEVLGVGAVPAFVAMLASPGAVLANERFGPLLNDLGLTDPSRLALWGGAALVVLFVVKNLYLAALVSISARYTHGLQASLEIRLFTHYLRSAYPFHLTRSSAELLRNATTEVIALVDGVLKPSLTILLEFLVIAFVGVLIMVVEPVISISIVSVLGVATLLFYAGMRKKAQWYASESQRYRAVSIKAVNEGLAGIKDVKVLAREDYFAAAYRESARFTARANRHKALFNALPRLFLEVIVVTGVLSVAMLLSVQQRSAAEVIPVLALLAAAAMRFMPSFQRIMANLHAFQWGEVSLNRVADDLEDEPASVAEPVSVPLDGADVVFDNVSFRYADGLEDALFGVSLEIPRGAAVAFVGQSGAGKTTLVDLLLGLLEPTAGQIRVGGQPLSDPGVVASWRRAVGYIPQEIYLTDDTIRHNVAFGVPDGEIDDAAVWRALEAAQLAAFVRELPDGFDATVGDRGTRLSGGQRQRIGIARALYHDPEVLVMDEATSALDNQTEREFVEALERLTGDRTVVVVAHRLSTVQECDTLYLFEEGRLVAEGTYDTLLETSETFRVVSGVPTSVTAPEPATL